MKPFIRAAEVWLPSKDGTLLEFGAGLFGEAQSFADTSRAMTFGRAEGLPGDAWDQGRPILLKSLEGAHFNRIDAAKQAGLTCAVALPFFVAGQLRAVLVLFGGDHGTCNGALELWRNDPRISSDMTLDDGYYGGVAGAFEAISRDTYLPRGTGLPGMAWQREELVIMSELSESTRFLRGEQATDAGIRRGMALPCTTSGHASYVLTLLSGGDTPLVHRAERWLIDLADERLLRAGGYCEQQGGLHGQPTTIAFGAWRDGAVKALLAGQPVVFDQLAAEDGDIGESARLSGAHSAVCVPIMVEDKAAEVAVLYL